MKLNDVRDFLKENLKIEGEQYFGLKDAQWLGRVTNNCFDDQNNYDERWRIIKDRVPTLSRKSCGCSCWLWHSCSFWSSKWI